MFLLFLSLAQQLTSGMGLGSTSTESFAEISRFRDFADEVHAKYESLRLDGSERPGISRLIMGLLDYEEFSVLYSFLAGCHKALGDLFESCDYNLDEEFRPVFENVILGHYKLESFMAHLRSRVEGMVHERTKEKERACILIQLAGSFHADEPLRCQVNGTTSSMTPGQISVRRTTCLRELTEHEERYKRSQSRERSETEGARENSEQETANLPASRLPHGLAELTAWLTWLFRVASSLGLKKLAICFGVLVISMSFFNFWVVLGALNRILWVCWSLAWFVLKCLFATVGSLLGWAIQTTVSLAVVALVVYFILTRYLNPNLAQRILI